MLSSVSSFRFLLFLFRFQPHISQFPQDLKSIRESSRSASKPHEPHEPPVRRGAPSAGDDQKVGATPQLGTALWGAKGTCERCHHGGRSAGSLGKSHAPGAKATAASWSLYHPCPDPCSGHSGRGHYLEGLVSPHDRQLNVFAARLNHLGVRAERQTPFPPRDREAPPRSFRSGTP